jgi:hypothetical protein
MPVAGLREFVTVQRAPVPDKRGSLLAEPAGQNVAMSVGERNGPEIRRILPMRIVPRAHDFD